MAKFCGTKSQVSDCICSNNNKFTGDLFGSALVVNSPNDHIIRLIYVASEVILHSRKACRDYEQKFFSKSKRPNPCFDNIPRVSKKEFEDQVPKLVRDKVYYKYEIRGNKYYIEYDKSGKGIIVEHIDDGAWDFEDMTGTPKQRKSWIEYSKSKK